MASILANLAFSMATVLGLTLVSLHLLARHSAEQDAAESHVKGCRSLGLVGRSNMNDQYATQNVGTRSTSSCKVKALFIYPIKSCGRIELSGSDVVATGLRYDRQFCFAQLLSEQAGKIDGDLGVNMGWTHKWKFITQRRFPRLSQIHTEVWIPDASLPDYSPGSEWVRSKGCLVCKFAFTPDWEWNGMFKMETIKALGVIIKAKLAARSFTAEPMVTFRLPIAPNSDRTSSYRKEVMQIWKDSPEAINVTSDIPRATLAKLKYFLGVSNPLALFMADPLKRRDIFRNAPTRDEAGYQPGTGFADAYPLSIMGLVSVQDVAGKLSSKRLDALRFRANVYISETPAFTEDTWKLIRIGNLNYHVSCRTTRCTLPNVDQETGIADKQEPYHTLKKVRAYVDDGAGEHPCLGMQMVPMLKDEMGSESIAVGDGVEVLETGKHSYVRMFQ